MIGEGNGVMRARAFHVYRNLWYLQLDWMSCAATQKAICREAERATTDLNIQMKSSRRGASNGGVQKYHIFMESYS